ncbi:MAG TPA: substrate-binding domain-containing protein [Candidatus Pullichristensenella stercorigallinarum]|uniref:Substrate-binding domain-containing protein n=1 Tax=Candidatus Pullichristensenella stercorigallinarum TaxID=2840909 RepID=A0A9D0ZL56_9FIRM|nr:substrate-binding domain-containing protein [Candidatus Pullichristensenella stercorigallinarum]
MKKLFAIVLALVLTCAVAFAAEGPITVISREDGSGTRSAFIELTGVEQDDVDMTTVDAVITNSTAVMLTSVSGDPNAIGYVSMGSLNETVKAVSVDGAAATVEGVKDGSYTLSRPFNVTTYGEVGEITQDFLNYIMSAEGQAVISENGYIAVDDAAESYTASGLSGEITVGGSSSVTPVMEKLAEAYMALNPDVTIIVQQSDSTTGVTGTIEGTVDMGMASRAIKDEEVEQGVNGTTIAMDGIAVIVNLENDTENLTTEQIMNIYTGAVTDWSELAE